MSTSLLLLLATVLYAGYNLFIKVSGDHIPASATTIVSATLVLQLAALFTSATFAGILTMRGMDILGLPPRAYLWAALAGICIGAAEITYLYLFGGLGTGAVKLSANIVIPFVVGGTIVLTVIVSAALFHEAFGWSQIAGSVLVVSGIILLYLDT
ncbi:MAG: hypothetical protein GY798_35330 [Hyphomicrobiales bacterium]|nr:hypothetical protein [Hyphomicrobiales bacterium]